MAIADIGIDFFGNYLYVDGFVFYNGDNLKKQRKVDSMKRLFSILLCAAMLIGLLPTVAWAGDPDPATVADFTAEDSEKIAAALAALGGEEKATWDGTTKTLTLKGVDFDGVVKLPENATIVLEDGTTNKIYGASNPSDDGATTASCGILALGSLTIQGNGVLEVKAPDGSDISYGIYSSNDVTISGGTVTATGGEAGYGSFGIYATEGSVTIEDGEVNATGGTANGDYGESYGIKADDSVTIIGHRQCHGRRGEQI